MGTFGAFWGLLGVVLLLGSAVYRLAGVAMGAFSSTFFWHHWAGLILVALFMAYAEGYRGFQQRFSPRVAARARYLRNNTHFIHALLAPLFCMGFFHATRKRKITSLSLTFGIIILVTMVRFIPQPWRGIIDFGVVIGLAWGLVSLIIFGIIAFTSEDFPYSPEVPDAEADRRAAA